MPLARLIFFAEPVELTDVQIEEARQLGHLAEDQPEPVLEPPAVPQWTGLSPTAPDTGDPEEQE